ncbi:hypothetical protein ACFONN_07100 [Dyella humi]|uniref:Lipoprotein n=1 Tax=Dyella humi TaxID=1770547 RepID=A0ABW8IKT2_9GAMM
MKRLLGIVLALLAGCGHSPQGSGSSGTASSASQGSRNIQAQPPAPLSQGDQGPKADPSTPLSDYTRADDPSWLTYVYVSRLQDPPNDDEKMKLFSPKYFNESDAFKKHDIMTADLPTVNATLEKYRKLEYFILQTEQPFGTFALLKPYDFQSQSFHIDGCGQFAYQASQGIYLKINPTPSMCDVKVVDTNVAHTIESLRANFHLKLMFTYYFFVDGIDSSKNQINATATHLHIDFQDLQQDSKTVASIDVD